MALFNSNNNGKDKKANQRKKAAPQPELVFSADGGGSSSNQYGTTVDVVADQFAYATDDEMVMADQTEYGYDDEDYAEQGENEYYDYDGDEEEQNLATPEETFDEVEAEYPEQYAEDGDYAEEYFDDDTEDYDTEEDADTELKDDGDEFNDIVENGYTTIPQAAANQALNNNIKATNNNNNHRKSSSAMTDLLYAALAEEGLQYSTTSTTTATNKKGKATNSTNNSNGEPNSNKEKVSLSLHQLFGIQQIKGTCFATDAKHVATIGKLRGIETRLMNASEKAATVTAIKRLLESQSTPQQLAARLRPHSSANYINFLRKQLDQERRPEMRQQYHLQINHFQKHDREKLLIDRFYYYVSTAAKDEIQALGEDASKAKFSLQFVLETVANTLHLPRALRRRLIRDYAGNEEDSAAKATSDPATDFATNLISNAIKDTLQTRTASFGNALESSTKMGYQPIRDEIQLAEILGECFASPYARSYRRSVANNNNNNRDGDGGNSSNNKVESKLTAAATLDTIRRLLYSAGSYEEHSDYIKLGDEYIASFFIADYPTAIAFGAMREFLILKDVKLDYALHIEPLDNLDADDKLRNNTELMVAANQVEQGGESDPTRQHRIRSARELRDGLAKGNLRIFMVGMRFAVRANSLEKLKADTQLLTQILKYRHFTLVLARYNQLAAFLSAQPLGRDYLGEDKLIRERVVRNMRAEAIAALWPNVIQDAYEPDRIDGIPIGINREEGRIVTFQRWGKVNANSTRVGTSGSGKSVGAEREVILELLHDRGVRCFLLDPQGVMSPLIKLMGGVEVDMGTRKGKRLNPMDRYIIGGDPEPIGERIVFLTKFLQLLNKGVEIFDDVGLSRAIQDCYNHFEQGTSALPAIGKTLEALAGNSLNPDEVLPKLLDIYRVIRETYGLINCGLVAGTFEEPDTGFVPGGFALPHNHSISRKAVATSPFRPVTVFSADANCYYYAGGRYTNEPLPKDAFAKSASGIGPARVWYPHPKWWRKVQAHFESLVLASGIFAKVDPALLPQLIETCFVELKCGMPILSDFVPFLCKQGLYDLAAKLEIYTDPNLHGQLFNGYTDIVLNNRLVGFNLFELKDDHLKTVRVFQLIEYIWGLVQVKPARRTILEADEMGVIFKNNPEIGKWVSDIFMRGRALGMSTDAIVQNILSLIGSEWGLECIENASRHVLMKMEEVASPRVQQQFKLTGSQVTYLTNANPGQSLQKVGDIWCDMEYLMPQELLDVLDTRPAKNNEAAESNEAATVAS